MRKPLLVLSAFCFLLFLPASFASGQEFVMDDAPEVPTDHSGWSGRLSISGNFSLSHNSRVVGQTDGTTLAIGNNINGRLSFVQNGHNLRNTLRNSQTFNRTPTIPELVKTADELRFESLYLYHFEGIDWIGPFARVAFNTAVFRGFDVQAEEVDYVLGEDLVVRDDRLRLTNAFSPFTLRESVGGFLRPSDDVRYRSIIRLGAGARQVFADGQLVVQDDPETEGVIELGQLQSFNQIGAEAVAELTGEINEGNVVYSLEAETLIPFYNSQDTGDDTPFDLANVELAATLSFKMLAWASLDYQFRAARIPALLDDWQISNNLLLSITWAAGFGNE